MTDAQVAAIKRRSLSVPISAIVAIIGIYWPRLSMFGFLLVPILVRLLGRERH